MGTKTRAAAAAATALITLGGAAVLCAAQAPANMPAPATTARAGASSSASARALTPTPAPTATAAAPAVDVNALPWETVETVVPAPADDGAPFLGIVAHPAQGAVVTDRSPEAGGTPIALLPETTLADPTELPVIGQSDSAWRVLLPARTGLPSRGKSSLPGTGWVAKAAATTRAQARTVDVDLEAGTVTVLDGKATVLTVPIRVSGGADTPRGRGTVLSRYMTQTSRLCGVGPEAMTSLQSPRMDGYDGANTAIAGVHSLGEYCIHYGGYEQRTPGCVILQPADLDAWNRAVPVGTPITVH
ncbi:L,D-transpeptidase [Sinomonas sp. RB5]